MRPMQHFVAHGPVYLETNGFILKSLTPADVTERFLAWLSDKEMLEGLNIADIQFDAPKLKNFISQFDNQRNYFIGIFDKKSSLLVGFYTIDVNLLHKTALLTTGIGEKAYQGRHTLWATIDALLDYFYAVRDIHKFVGRILSSNIKMLFNFKDNPRFILEAVLKDECLLTSGERVDVLSFASFKNDGGKPADLSYYKK